MVNDGNTMHFNFVDKATLGFPCDFYGLSGFSELLSDDFSSVGCLLKLARVGSDRNAQANEQNLDSFLFEISIIAQFRTCVVLFFGNIRDICTFEIAPSMPVASAVDASRCSRCQSPQSPQSLVRSLQSPQSLESPQSA